jgi:hypothetical protein
MHTAQARVQLSTGEGARELAAGIERAVGSADTRHSLYLELNAEVAVTRDVLSRWAATLVSQTEGVQHLSDFAELHRRMVQLLGFLSFEEQNRPLPIGEGELAEKLNAIVRVALDQDKALFDAADHLAPIH